MFIFVGKWSYFELKTPIVWIRSLIKRYIHSRFRAGDNLIEYPNLKWKEKRELRQISKWTIDVIGI